MRSEKGMSHIVLVIVILVIILIVAGSVYVVNKLIKERKIESLETNMLQIQGKTKILQEEATMEKKDELLEGRKVENNENLQAIQKLLEENIISKDEEHYSKYYIIDELDLEEMKLTNIDIKDGYFIVNYDTLEVIFTDGMKIDGNMYYKLSDLEKFSEEKDKEKEEKDKKNDNTVDENTVEQEEKTEEQQEETSEEQSAEEE